MPPDGQFDPPSHAHRFPVYPILLALACVALTLALRIAGPWNILDNDQLRPHAYIQDILRNNNWLVQHDWTGDVASKPPLYAWIGALPALLTNRVGQLELAIPSALGVLIGAGAIALATARVLGARTAGIATLAFIANPLIIKQTTLARTDALYAGLTTAAALLAFRAWRARKGWWEVWLLLALATLTKGPLTVVLAFAGLLFVRRSGPPLDRPRTRQWPEHAMGVVVFLALAGGWFAAAWLHEGQPFIDKVLGRELLGHVTGASKEHLEHISIFERLLEWVVGLFKPTLYLLARAAPWSVFAAFALVRTFRDAHPDHERQALERFCAGWLIVGLAIFSVVPHQRADLLSPIWAPGAILAASFLSRRVGTWSLTRVRAAVVSVLLGVGVFVIVAYWIVPRRDDNTARFALIREAFHQTLDHAIPPAMITPLDGPYLFTAFGETLPSRISIDQAARLLSGDAPAFVSTRDPDVLVDAVRARSGRPVFALVRNDQIAIVSNTRTLSPTHSVAALLNGLLIETAGARLAPPRLGTIMVESTSHGSAVMAIQNQSDVPRHIRWRTTDGRSGTVDVGPLREAIVTIPPTP